MSIDGVKINETGSNAAVDAVGTNIRVTHSLLAGDGAGGFTPGVWVKGGQTVVLEDDVISGYAPEWRSAAALGGNGTVFLSNNTITNNSTGVAVGTGTAFTRSNNTIVANTTNVSGSLTPLRGANHQVPHLSSLRESVGHHKPLSGRNRRRGNRGQEAVKKWVLCGAWPADLPWHCLGRRCELGA